VGLGGAALLSLRGLLPLPRIQRKGTQQEHLNGGIHFPEKRPLDAGGDMQRVEGGSR